jgi:hypothetical protein
VALQTNDRNSPGFLSPRARNLELLYFAGDATNGT